MLKQRGNLFMKKIISASFIISIIIASAHASDNNDTKLVQTIIGARYYEIEPHTFIESSKYIKFYKANGDETEQTINWQSAFGKKPSYDQIKSRYLDPNAGKIAPASAVYTKDRELWFFDKNKYLLNPDGITDYGKTHE